MPARLSVQCKEGFHDYKYFCKKFKNIVPRLKKLADKAKLEDELLPELEARARFFKKRDLEIVVYMDNDDDWKTIRAQLVAAPGQEKNRLKLTEEKVTLSSRRASKVTWEILETNLIESVRNKTFVCVVASSYHQGLESVAHRLAQSTRPVIDEQNGIFFCNTEIYQVFSLSEMMQRGFEPTSMEGKTADVDLYDRVAKVLEARIVEFSQMLFKFLKNHLPFVAKGEFTDLFDIKDGHCDEQTRGVWKIMYEATSWYWNRKDVDIGMSIPEIPKLPEELQKDLLRLNGVKGCGTIWGKLTVHATAESMGDLARVIPGILQEYGYRHPYRLHEFVKEELHCPIFRAGVYFTAELDHQYDQDLPETIYIRENVLRSQDPKEVAGTLGCFVTKEGAAGDSNMASGGASLPKRNVYGITCAHCVQGCIGDIKLQVTEDTFHRISSMNETIHYKQNRAIDIAAIKIDDDLAAACKGHLQYREENAEPDEIRIDDRDRIWTFYEGEPKDMARHYPEGPGGPGCNADVENNELSVFKKGGKTDFTYGLVVSGDYLESSEDFNLGYNILIDAKVGLENNDVFSDYGDSGSAVCTVCPNGHLEVLAILQGSISTETATYSYASHMKKNLQKLGESHGIKFGLPNFV